MTRTSLVTGVADFSGTITVSGVVATENAGTTITSWRFSPAKISTSVRAWIGSVIVNGVFSTVMVNVAV